MIDMVLNAPFVFLVAGIVLSWATIGVFYYFAKRIK